MDRGACPIEGGARGEAVVEAIIVFAHGARNPEWALPVERVAAAVRALRPAAAVSVAFLELMTPSLAAAVEAAAASGVRRISVVPLFLSSGGHLQRDVPALMDEVRARHPDCEIELFAPVGEDPGVVQAMAHYAAGAGR
jgi:sirohydrochlorin cobaltochelatase